MSPLIVQPVFDEVHCAPPGLAVAVALVIGESPVAPAVHVTWTWLDPACAVTSVGAEGLVGRGAAVTPGFDAWLRPAAFDAWTVTT